MTRVRSLGHATHSLTEQADARVFGRAQLGAIWFRRKQQFPFSMNAARDPVSPNAGSNVTDISVNKPDRPCDICRKRKSKCVVKPGSAKCILCDFHQQACTFEENPTPRNKRKAGQPQAESPQVSKRRYDSLSSTETMTHINRSLSERPRHIDQLAAGKSIVQDYAELQGHSLLKTTLGYALTQPNISSLLTIVGFRTIVMLYILAHVQYTTQRF